MWSSTALPLLCALSELSSAVSAQQSIGLPISGPKKPGPGDTPEALHVSEAAGRHPNATTSVTFQRKYNNTKEEWTWRVNLTEIAVPDDISDLGSPSANFSRGLRVANTQWQLEWPGSSDDANNNNTFEAFLQERNLNASFTSLVVKHSSKIANNYDDSDGGDCEKVLGKDCTKALTEAAFKDLTEQLSALAGCKDALGDDGNKLDDGVSFDIEGKKPSGNESDTSPSSLTRDDTLLFRTSKAYEGDHDSDDTFQDARGALQIFIMRLTSDSDNRGDDDAGQTVLCRIVDKDADSPASAMSWGQPTVVLWSVVLLGTLFTALQ